MNAKDKKRIEAQQAAQISFLGRLDGMRTCYQQRLSVPERGDAGTLGELTDKQERSRAKARIESLTHAIQELRDLAV